MIIRRFLFKLGQAKEEFTGRTQGWGLIAAMVTGAVSINEESELVGQSGVGCTISQEPRDPSPLQRGCL